MKISEKKIAVVVCKQKKTFDDVFDTKDYEDVISYHGDLDIPIEEVMNMLNHLKKNPRIAAQGAEFDQLVVILDDYYYPKMSPMMKLTPEMGPVAFGRWNSKKRKFVKTGYLA
jgi:hypothetical protein